MRSTTAQQDYGLIRQIIAKPAFKQIVDLPVFAWQEIGIVIGSYAVIVGGGALFLNGVLPYWVVLLCSSLAIYAAFTPLHDATHNSVSSSLAVNDLLGTIAAQLFVPGITTRIYRYLHLEHHRCTGDKDHDPDEKMVSLPMPFKLIAIMFIDVTWAIWYTKHLNQRSTRDIAIDGLALVVWLTWHVAWFLSPYAVEFFLVLVIPQRLGLLITGYLFAAIQHPEGVKESENPLQATRMFKGGLFGQIVMIAQSQHLMHHLFPRVPYYRYHLAWKLAKPDLINEALVWSWPVVQTVEPAPESLKAYFEVEIAAVENVGAAINAYTLKPIDVDKLPAFKPGAHIDVRVGDGLVRQYSLTGLAVSGQYSIAVKREPDGRGGSRRLHDNFCQGDTLVISQPRNLFALSPDAQNVVLFGGGIGLTPLLSMAEALQKQGRSFEFHVAAHSEAQLPFSKYLACAPYASAVTRYVGERVTEDDVPLWQEGSAMYLCGPDGFMQHIQSLAKLKGWPDGCVHLERFVAPTTAEVNRPFAVKLAKSNIHIQVPADKTLLQALQESQVPVAAACEQGLCGTCVCQVLEGDIEHRDSYFSDEDHQAGLMASCVSRAKSKELLLDL